MKKNVMFLGFCLLWAHGAGADSLHGLFQEETHQKQISNQSLSQEDPPSLTHKPTVVKPQTVYLEDLNTPEKTKLKTTSTLSTPTTAPDAGKIKTKPLPEAFAKQTPPPPSSATSYRQKSSSSQGQYAPFATKTSRQQAAHSLITQAKNEKRSYPAGLDAFVIEFDETFRVLSPNMAIRDMYKTDTLDTPTVVKATKIPVTESAQPSLPSNTLILDDPAAVTTQKQHQRHPAPQISTPKKTKALVTRNTNKQQSHPAGLDAFVIEFDEKFGVLAPKRTIQDLYKTHPPAVAQMPKAEKRTSTKTRKNISKTNVKANVLILDDAPVASVVDQTAQTTVKIRQKGTLSRAIKEIFQNIGLASSETLIANTVNALKNQGILVNLVRAGEVLSLQNQNLTFRGKTVRLSLPPQNLSPVVKAKSGDTLIGLVKQAYPQSGQTATLSETKILNWLTPLQDQGLHIHTIPVGTKVAFNLDTGTPIVMIGGRHYQSPHGKNALGDRE